MLQSEHSPQISGGTMTSIAAVEFYLQLRRLLAHEEGQDLVEYALVVALIAFGAIAGMQFLAAGINNAFSDIANVVTSNIT
jgi:pilus assembly protein Flp/PilA